LLHQLAVDRSGGLEFIGRFAQMLPRLDELVVKLGDPVG
jgi:hypothetical protein